MADSGMRAKQGDLGAEPVRTAGRASNSASRADHSASAPRADSGMRAKQSDSLPDMSGRGPWAFEDLTDAELLAYAERACECVTPQLTGTRNGYTCPAHRAQREIDKRAGGRG